MTRSFPLLRYPSGSRLPRHAHAECSLVVTVRGHFTERAGQEQRTLTSNTVMLRAAGEVHEDEFAESTECLVVRLTGSLDTNPPATLVKSGRRVALLCARLVRENAAVDRASAIAARGIALELLAEVLRADTGGRVSREVELVRKRILTSYAEPLRIADMAASAGIEPVQLSRMFKRAYGCTPTEMLREERIARAVELIRQRSDSLTDIAGRCGFYDQSHLANVFRRVMGMTPRQYAESSKSR